MRRISELLFRPVLVPFWVLAIAALVLLPDLPRPGLWEPNELAVADAAVARAEKAAHPTPAPPPPPPELSLMERFKRGVVASCPKSAPEDRAARSLTDRLTSAGLALDDSDGGMRFPFAMLGILCVIATAGIGIRLGGGRAGVLAGLACLSFPLFAFDARMLTGDIGTPTGAALIIYGAVAIATLRQDGWLLVDLLLGFAAIAAGTAIGFQGGGALLGLLVPAIAIAIAGGFGRRWTSPPGGRLELPAVALLATVASALIVYVLATQAYTATFPTPGQRELFGYSFIPSDCWSTALGGLWRRDDDLRMGLDSVFEQIAFGTFPVGVLAPLALFGLSSGGRDERRTYAGRLALAWAAAAWIATQLWHRKVGFALWPGFPALAVAIGVWIDQLLEQRAAPRDRDGAVAQPLVAMFVVAAIATIAVDLTAFPDRVASLLIGSDTIKYPKTATILHLPLRAWVIAMGAGFGILFGAGAWLWRLGRDDRPAPVRWLARHGVAAAAAAMGVIAAFWTWGWHDTMSHHLSSKHLFSVYRDLRQDGDALGIMGDLGNAPRYYAGGPWEPVAGRDALMKFLARPSRVFALTPASELCAIHRAAQGKPYFVLDDSNPRTLLLSNKVDGAKDVNSLTRTVLRAEPKGIGKKPPSPIVFDDKIELIGWTLPAHSAWGSTVKVTLYFKVRGSVAGSWKIFEHFDPAGGGPRFQGDHDPISGRCATSFWQAGDFVVDENEVEASGVGLNPGSYELWIGFFTGTNPNWTNMHITQAPSGWKDNAERVHLGTIVFD